MDIEQRLEKLEFQMARVGSTISHTEHPVDALILEMNWGKEDLESAMSIFEKYDQTLTQGGTISSGQFETDFEQQLGLGYQGVKPVVLAFYRESRWTKVCEAYKKALSPNPPIEYSEIN